MQYTTIPITITPKNVDIAITTAFKWFSFFTCFLIYLAYALDDWGGASVTMISPDSPLTR